MWLRIRVLLCVNVLYEVQFLSALISFGYSVTACMYGGIFTRQFRHWACYDFLTISMVCHVRHSCWRKHPCKDYILTFSTVLLSRCPWKYTSQEKKKRGKLVLESVVISTGVWGWYLSVSRKYPSWIWLLVGQPNGGILYVRKGYNELRYLTAM